MLPVVRAELTIEVGRTPEDVFAYLTDVSNLPTWQSGVHTAQIEDAVHPTEQHRVPADVLHPEGATRVRANEVA